jgi:hypothetical protein
LLFPFLALGYPVRSSLWSRHIKRIRERIVKCPSCSAAFHSNAAKPICPECGTAQLIGLSLAGPSERSLVARVPQPLSELSSSQIAFLHRVLDTLNSRPGFFNDYVFIETGYGWIPRILLDHELAFVVDRKEFNSYQLTPKGIAKLSELNENLGELTTLVRSSSATEPAPKP